MFGFKLEQKWEKNAKMFCTLKYPEDAALYDLSDKCRQNVD